MAHMHAGGELEDALQSSSRRYLFIYLFFRQPPMCACLPCLPPPNSCSWREMGDWGGTHGVPDSYFERGFQIPIMRSIARAIDSPLPVDLLPGCLFVARSVWGGSVAGGGFLSAV